MPDLARDDVGQLRLVAQQLAGPHAPTPAAAVQWMTASHIDPLRDAGAGTTLDRLFAFEGVGLGASVRG